MISWIFRKIEAGKLAFEKIPFNISERLENTLKMLSIRAKKKGLELVYHEHPGIPAQIVGDPDRLNQIIINLVGNSLKFTEKGEIKVEIAVLPENGAKPEKKDAVTLIFSVEDTGIGIAPEKQAMIFEAFTQADSFTTRMFGGTGLGLAISKQLVEIMGGSMWLESVPGQGATFFFTLPFTKGDDQNGQMIHPFLKSLQGAPVLVVEGNSKFRRVYDELFHHWNMAPTICDSILKGRDILKTAVEGKHPFRLMVLDVNLFDNRSSGALEEIMSNPELSLPMIFILSPGTKTRHFDACHLAGVTFCLSKPVTPSDLLDAVLRVHGQLPEDPEGNRDATRLFDPSGVSFKILLAEDNPVNQKLATRVLEKMGHQVTVVENGEKAVAHVKEGSYDLIFMDVQMPSMDGLEATRRIRVMEHNTDRHLPIVAMTANAMKGDRERCLEAGMDDYIAKPIRFQELADVLARNVGSNKAVNR